MSNTKNNIFIEIITAFKGQNNIKAAERDFLGLTSAIKGLAAAYSVEQVVTKSLDAFKNQQASVALLDNSLRNLGTSYSALQPVIDKQNESMMNLGFTDNSTLAALTKLTTALGNPAKALDVLSVTADLARYKNQDLVTTAEQVSKAIAGQSRAFADLGLKIDKTLTPQNAFQKLLDQAKIKAGGAAVAYSKTLGGALDIASAKAENASVKLGKSLAPSVQKLAEFAVKYITPVITVLANNIAPIIAIATALLGVAAAIKAIGIASAITTGELAINPLFAGAAAAGFVVGQIIKNKPKPVNKSNPSAGIDLQHMGVTPGGQSTQSIEALSSAGKKVQAVKTTLTAEQQLAAWEKKWNLDAAKAAADQIKAANQKLAIEKAAKALKDAGKALDLQAIQINAALISGKDTLSDREKTVLQLQQAILNENSDAATKLAEQLKTANDNNPFQKLTAGAVGTTDAVNVLSSALGGLNAQLQATRSINPLGGAYDLSNYTGGLSSNNVPSGGNSGTQKVEVTVTTSEDLKATIQQSFVNNTASGVPSTYNRNMDVAW